MDTASILEYTLRTVFVILAGLLAASTVLAQKNQPVGFQGEWNWVVYAKDKSELPPAYQSMELSEVPAYAVDLTLRKRRNRVSGHYAILARYLARIDEGGFRTTPNGRSLRIRLQSNFGGSATVILTVNGDLLSWRTIKSTGENYFPKQAVLRRLKAGEKPPYVAEEEGDPGNR
jgi:hypothetical protein